MPSTDHASRVPKRIYGKDLNPADIFLTSKSDLYTFHKILAAYGINNVTSLDFPTTFSTTSRKLIIFTSNQAYFLKEKPLYCCSPDALHLSASFQDYLAKRLDFVPPIVYTLDHKPYFQFGSRTFLLTEFRRGRIFRATLEDVKSAGEALGKLHTVSYEYSTGTTFPKKSSRDDAQTFIQMAAALPGSENDPWKIQVIDNLLDTINNYKINNPGLPYIVNHGDPAPFNLVFSNQGVIAVNDFDNSGNYPRIRDVADGIVTHADGVNYAGTTSSFKTPITEQFSINKAKEYLASYLHYAPAFTQAEKGSLLSEICNRWCELMALGLVRGDFGYYDLVNKLRFPQFTEEHIYDLY